VPTTTTSYVFTPAIVIVRAQCRASVNAGKPEVFPYRKLAIAENEDNAAPEKYKTRQMLTEIGVSDVRILLLFLERSAPRHIDLDRRYLLTSYSSRNAILSRFLELTSGSCSPLFTRYIQGANLRIFLRG
jgi:hypothetical protein